MERDKGMEEKGPVEGVADEIYEVGRDCSARKRKRRCAQACLSTRDTTRSEGEKEGERALNSAKMVVGPGHIVTRVDE